MSSAGIPKLCSDTNFCHAPNPGTGLTKFPIADLGANSLRSTPFSAPSSHVPGSDPGILPGGFSG